MIKYGELLKLLRRDIISLRKTCESDLVWIVNILKIRTLELGIQCRNSRLPRKKRKKFYNMLYRESCKSYKQIKEPLC